MAVARSSFYHASSDRVDDTALVERMHAIQGEFPAYGYRRITAQLRADGVLVNRKRVARLMRLHGLQVRPRRRYVATTDSDHDSPIFPNLAKDMVPGGPDELWVADITYIAITTGFVYRCYPRCLVTPGGRLCAGADDRGAVDCGGAGSGDRHPAAAERLHSPFGSREPVRFGTVSQETSRARAGGIDGPAG